MKRPSVLVIFLTVFIDLIGFGIIVPLIPSYSEHFGAHGALIGLIFASYSAMQFIFSPIWGRLSDRHGRRPILLISTAGAAVSYMVFARSTGLENHTAALWLMVVSRMFAGICGGNITVAQAYIADITPPAERSKKMGLIGMAFGLGFILGPPGRRAAPRPAPQHGQARPSEIRGSVRGRGWIGRRGRRVRAPVRPAVRDGPLGAAGSSGRRPAGTRRGLTVDRDGPRLRRARCSPVSAGRAGGGRGGGRSEPLRGQARFLFRPRLSGLPAGWRPARAARRGGGAPWRRPGTARRAARSDIPAAAACARRPDHRAGAGAHPLGGRGQAGGAGGRVRRGPPRRPGHPAPRECRARR